LAKKLGLINKQVFFIKDWVPYDKRIDYLSDSNIGVVSSPNIPEANLFFKTRIYDYIWSELPIILNDCEAFAPIIKEKGLGLVVKTGDIVDWSKKINILATNKTLVKEIKANIKKYKREIPWQKTLQPITEFAFKPYSAADKKKGYSPLLKNSIIVNIDVIKKNKI